MRDDFNRYVLQGRRPVQNPEFASWFKALAADRPIARTRWKRWLFVTEFTGVQAVDGTYFTTRAFFRGRHSYPLHWSYKTWWGARVGHFWAQLWVFTYGRWIARRLRRVDCRL